MWPQRQQLPESISRRQGGIVWRCGLAYAHQRLALIAEYSRDRYTLEASRGNFSPRIQMNYGASYQITEGITLGLNWLYGRSVGGSASFQLDPTTEPYPEKLGPAPLTVNIRSEDEQRQALADMMRSGAARSAAAAPQIARRDGKNAFVDALWQEESGRPRYRYKRPHARADGRRGAAGLRRDDTAYPSIRYRYRFDQVAWPKWP